MLFGSVIKSQDRGRMHSIRHSILYILYRYVCWGHWCIWGDGSDGGWYALATDSQSELTATEPPWGMDGRWMVSFPFVSSSLTARANQHLVPSPWFRDPKMGYLIFTWLKSNLEKFQDFYQGIKMRTPNNSLANHSGLGMVHKVVAVHSFLPEMGISWRWSYEIWGVCMLCWLFV